MTDRRYTLISIAAYLAFLSFAFDINTPLAVAKPITLAYQTPTLGSNLPIFAAAELGLFAADNLEVKTVFIQGGPTAWQR